MHSTHRGWLRDEHTKNVIKKYEYEYDEDESHVFVVACSNEAIKREKNHQAKARLGRKKY